MAESKRLLIMSCSKAKRHQPGPAVDVYDGPSYRVLRRAKMRGRKPDVLILSAKHGILREDTEIEPYDQLLGQNPSEDFVQAARAQLTTYLGGKRYSSGFAFLGPNYYRVLAPVLPTLPVGTLTMAEGAIGMRLRQLKMWLDEGGGVS